MLKKITLKNLNSIDVCEIDFKKGSYKFLEDNINGDIVNPVAFYGHNGSGKTSFFNGIHTLISLMIEPVELLLPFVVNNFKFEKYQNGKTKDKSLITGSIELVFELEGIEYDYLISTSTAPFIRIENEYLKKNGKDYFTRNTNSYTYKDKPYVYGNMSKLVPALRILASEKIEDKTIQDCYSYICSFVFVNLPFINRGAFVTSKMFKNTNVYDLLVNHSDEVKEILKGYDEFPIYTIVKEEKPNSISPTGPYSIILEGKNFKGKLPFDMISAGMKNQSLLLSIIASMPRHSVLFVDELEQALHPSAIKSFLNVVKKKDIQLVFSSHNTYILQMLRPDQVYFSKWSDGSSKYFRLSKIYPNIREINNIEKMYLSSVFDEAINNG